MSSIAPLLSDVRDLVLANMPRVQDMRYDIRWKHDGSPVTDADVYLEGEIRAFLAARLPDLTFIGEESWTADDSLMDGWIAVLDPIDGTENFCSGLKEWGTSLSIWQGPVHRGSMLLMPELGEFMSTESIPFVPCSRIVGFSSSFNDDVGCGLAETPEGIIYGPASFP